MLQDKKDQLSLPSNKLSREQIQQQARKDYQIEEAQIILRSQNPQNQGFFANFFDIVHERSSSLFTSIFGDTSYVRVNMYSVNNKVKILEYLKEKYLLMSFNLEENTKKNYYNYNSDFFIKKPETLQAAKNMLLQGKTQVDMVEENIERIKSSKNYIKANFLNESAFEFDRQRYGGIIWGLMTGAFINSTLYRRGRSVRKAALIISFGHVFGQITYQMNLDRYFDSVYPIFEEQANEYMKKEEIDQNQKLEKVWIKNTID